jgi:hypothetical protein
LSWRFNPPVPAPLPIASATEERAPSRNISEGTARWEL